MLTQLRSLTDIVCFYQGQRCAVIRYDTDYVVFAVEFDQFKVVRGISYVPTEKAPKEAREAMDRYNKNNIKQRKRYNSKKIR